MKYRYSTTVYTRSLNESTSICALSNLIVVKIVFLFTDTQIHIRLGMAGSLQAEQFEIIG